MEPVTHFLTGACLARAGLNRKAAYATVAMTLAAEMPDLDTLWTLDGPVASFQHHRGWTHTFAGFPIEAAVVVGVIWSWHRWRGRERKPGESPVRWGWLYGLALIALLSHLVLDWTTSYGVRPFFPFNPRWYAGSFVFVVEPVMLVLLVVGLAAPSLFGLINSEVGARREMYRGQGWAVFALLGVLALWGWRFYEQQSALQLALNADFGGEQVVRVGMNSYPVTPFRWYAVVETPRFYRRVWVDTWSGTTSSEEQADLFYKPPTTIATLVAKRSWLGEVYLDWSLYPMVKETGMDQDGNATVTFSDFRFMYDTLIFSGRSKPALTGTVLVNADHRVERMEFDGRVQR
jgi:inner membrane protein